MVDNNEWWTWPGYREEEPDDVTAWWREIRKTRRIMGDGVPESVNRWAHRLGVAHNTIKGWRFQKSYPSAAKVKEIVKRLGLPPSKYTEYMSLIQELSPPELSRPIRLLEGRIAAGEEGRVVGEVSSLIALPESIIQATRSSRDIIAFRLNETADSMEPAIPAGSIVFVDCLKGRDALGFVSGAPYAVVYDPNTFGICVKYVVRHDNELWLFPGNKTYKPQLAWTDDLSLLIVGKVFFFQGYPSHLSKKDSRLPRSE